MDEGRASAALRYCIGERKATLPSYSPHADHPAVRPLVALPNSRSRFGLPIGAASNDGSGGMHLQWGPQAVAKSRSAASTAADAAAWLVVAPGGRLSASVRPLPENASHRCSSFSCLENQEINTAKG